MYPLHRMQLNLINTEKRFCKIWRNGCSYLLFWFVIFFCRFLKGKNGRGLATFRMEDIHNDNYLHERCWWQIWCQWIHNKDNNSRIPILSKRLEEILWSQWRCPEGLNKMRSIWKWPHKVHAKHFILKLPPLESYAPRCLCVASHYYVVCISICTRSVYVFLCSASSQTNTFVVVSYPIIHMFINLTMIIFHSFFILNDITISRLDT